MGRMERSSDRGSKSSSGNEMEFDTFINGISGYCYLSQQGLDFMTQETPSSLMFPVQALTRGGLYRLAKKG